MKEILKHLSLIISAILSIAVIGVLLLLVLGDIDVFRHYNYRKWQTIYIENSGSLKIPKEWVYFIEEEKIYVVDEKNKPIMVETFSIAGFEEWEKGEIDQNKYFSEIISLKCLTSVGLSNSVAYGKVLIEVDGKKCEKYYINLPKFTDEIELIIWDETVDVKIIKKIAWSFEME